MPGDVLRRMERLDKALVGVTAFVRGRTIQPDIVELDLADVEDRKFRDQTGLPTFSPAMM
jgi:hypothetical protein